MESKQTWTPKDLGFTLLFKSQEAVAWRLGREGIVALSVPWLPSRRTGGPEGEQGNPFQETFFRLVMMHSLPKRHPKFLEATWGLSLASWRRKLYNVATVIALHASGREPKEALQETSFCSPECFVSYIYVLKRQDKDKHLWLQLRTN